MPEININGSSLFDETVSAENRFIIHSGGTSSGKSFSILGAIIYKAATTDNCLFSIVSESMPHLKRGVMRDFFNILADGYRESNHNKTDNTYKIGSSIIEFFSADQHDKVRGARRDYLFINECNNIRYETFQQLEVRTKHQVYLDFNPVAAFWLHNKILPNYDCYFRKSTYKDNPYLDDRIIKSIEARQFIDPSWWRVYGEGELGNLEGIVFSNFDTCKVIPEQIDRYWYGLDFGFSPDPTALIYVGLHGDCLYVDEILYETGLTGSDLVNYLRGTTISKSTAIYADCARPEIIAEINRAGFNTFGAVKGDGSIVYGIDLMKRYKIMITERSINTLKEFRNYQWLKDKDGNPTGKPIDKYCHSIDAIRYVVRMALDRPLTYSRAIILDD